VPVDLNDGAIVVLVAMMGEQFQWPVVELNYGSIFFAHKQEDHEGSVVVENHPMVFLNLSVRVYQQIVFAFFLDENLMRS